MLVLAVVSFVELDECYALARAESPDGKTYTAGGLALPVSVVDVYAVVWRCLLYTSDAADE